MSTNNKNNKATAKQTVVIAPPPSRIYQNIPSARLDLTQVSNPSHYEWTIQAPSGHELDELELDIELTPTTTSALAPLSGLIKALKVVNNDSGVVTDAITDGVSIGMMSIISQALREYARPSASPLNASIVRDPQAGTTATPYYSNWRWHAPYPGKKFTIILDLVAVNTVLVSATAVAASLTLVDRWVPAHSAQKYQMLAQSFPAVPKVAFIGVFKGALVNAAEFEANTNGITLGTDLTSEQVFRNEALSNDDLVGLGAPGTNMTGVDTPSIFDPATAANVAVLLARFLAAGSVKAVFTTPQSPICILFGMQDPTSMVVSG